MITEELLKSITSRAEVLSRRYYFLEKEDLFQEGYILLLDLDKKDLTDLQKHKAINNHFANLERHAVYRRKLEVNSSSLPVEDNCIGENEALEEVMMRNNITEELMGRLTGKELLLVDWLCSGVSLNDIADVLGIRRDTVRRKVMGIIAKRKEIDDVM